MRFSSQIRGRGINWSHANEQDGRVRFVQHLSDLRHLLVRTETGQSRSFNTTCYFGVTPGYQMSVKHLFLITFEHLPPTVKVAATPDGQKSRAAEVTGVGTLLLVLPPRAVRVQVAGEVVPEVRPVGHGAVPRAVRELEGAG